MAKAKKGSWVVTVRCTVDKEVVCFGCTEEQARADPFEYGEEEREIGQTDYEVTDVRPNE